MINFSSETDIVNKDLVNKAVKKLKEKILLKRVFLQPPKEKQMKIGKKLKRLIFKSTIFGDDTDRALQKMMDLGHIFCKRCCVSYG